MADRTAEKNGVRRFSYARTLRTFDAIFGQGFYGFCKDLHSKGFADGILSQIPELDEEILDPECGDGSIREIELNSWIKSFAGVI